MTHCRPTLAAICLGLLAALASVPADAQRLPARAPLAAVEGEVIVAFRPEAATLRKHALAARADRAAAQAALAERAATLGARHGRSLQAGAAVGPNVQVVRAAGVDATTLARQLASDPEVAYAVPNGRKRRLAAPNDPLYPATAPGVRANGPDSGQWYLRAPDSTFLSAINAQGAWDTTTGRAGVVVAVLDTGIRAEHPDLAGRVVPGYDFVSNATVANDGDGRDGDPSDPGDWVSAGDTSTSTFSSCTVEDSSWHGTATASLVAATANEGVGMAGGAHGARVQAVRVLGKCFGSDADIQAGMRWAAGIHVDGVPDNPTPAKVINMSLGGDGSCNAAYQAVVNEIVARGVVIVASAGNSVGGPVSEPANCPGVIGVLALRHVGTKVGFSDLGPEITVAAPGGNCVNTAVGTPCLYPILAATNSGTQGPAASAWSDSYNITVGTSFSSPLTAAVAALMVSARPDLTPEQARLALRSSARPFPTTGAGNGTNGLPVPACHAPTAGVQQDQCYCPNTGNLCGAGMLDAAAAVAAVVNASFVNMSYSPAAPTVGQPVNFRVSGVATTGSRPIASYSWTLVDGGGASTGFSSATNASTATLPTVAAGTAVIRLTVTDTAGNTLTTQESVRVSAAAVLPPPNSGGGGGGGGGGAASGAWVAGVGLATLVLLALERRRRAGRFRAAPGRA